MMHSTQYIPNCKSFDFFNIKFDHSSYSKFYSKYHFFNLLCIGLLIKVLQEWLKFNYICTNFLNKTSGQTYGKKVKRLTIWDGESMSKSVPNGWQLLARRILVCPITKRDYDNICSARDEEKHLARMSFKLFRLSDLRSTGDLTEAVRDALRGGKPHYYISCLCLARGNCRGLLALRFCSYIWRPSMCLL